MSIVASRYARALAEVVAHNKIEPESAVSQLNEIAELVETSSSRELSAAEKKALEQQMAAITGKIIRAGYSQDASLLGGAVVRVGSTIYDGSVRGRLKKIRHEISGS